MDDGMDIETSVSEMKVGAGFVNLGYPPLSRQTASRFVQNHCHLDNL